VVDPVTGRSGPALGRSSAAPGGAQPPSVAGRSGAASAPGGRGVAGRGPASSGVVGARAAGDPGAGRGGGARSRTGRDRDDRDPEVAATENDLWFVDDDLPAVVEPAGQTDPGTERAGPHVGGNRRV
jgi:hypothetical protein